jgi:NAD(P)-dependent dehydrogenase (short-subunit alcohol dehydrogenase family)
MFSLDGRVAVVSGAAGLLGEHFAAALAGSGAAVVLADLDEDTCQRRAERLEAGDPPARALAARCDVTDRGSWEALLGRTLEAFGRVDVLVNGAAFTNQSRTANFGSSFVDFPLADWRQILDVNLTGTLLGCQVVGRRMLEQGSGSIINLASLYGVVSPNHRMYPGTGIVQPVAYSVSKGGVVALTRYLATLWAEQGVRVNCITPGGVFNGHADEFVRRYAALCPAGRMARPDELRGAVVYLASQASGYCTGHNLVVDGGWTVW